MMEPETDFDLGQVIQEIIQSAGVAAEMHSEEIGDGMQLLAFDDPNNVGAPVDIIWPSNDMLVLTIASGGAAVELPLDRDGLTQLRTILLAVLTGEVKEHVDRRGAEIWIRDQNGNSVDHIVMRKGILPVRKGKTIERTYGSYSPV